jgi:hypothetical protein
MKLNVEIPECPVWLYKIIKLFVDRIYMIPVPSEKLLQDLIEDGEFDLAKTLIENLDIKYGLKVCIYTTKYSSRISRMEILGK